MSVHAANWLQVNRIHDVHDCFSSKVVDENKLAYSEALGFNEDMWLCFDR